jgi:hypothetical protein
VIPVLLLIASASTSSTSAAERRPFFVEAPAESQAEKLQYRAYLREVRQARWDEDRTLRTTFGVAALWQAAGIGVPAITLADESGFGLGLIGSIGLRRRLAAAWDLQARGSLVIGLLRVAGVDVDVTFRRGQRRFYWGLGPMFRMVFPHVEDRPISIGGAAGEHPLALGGGATLELGVLVGDERTIDVGARFTLGGTNDLHTDRRNVFFMAGYGGTYAWPE